MGSMRRSGARLRALVTSFRVRNQKQIVIGIF